jgi:hypothetical protein
MKMDENPREKKILELKVIQSAEEP